jgi:hypothetical protein
MRAPSPVTQIPSPNQPIRFTPTNELKTAIHVDLDEVLVKICRRPAWGKLDFFNVSAEKRFEFSFQILSSEKNSLIRLQRTSTSCSLNVASVDADGSVMVLRILRFVTLSSVVWYIVVQSWMEGLSLSFCRNRKTRETEKDGSLLSIESSRPFDSFLLPNTLLSKSSFSCYPYEGVFNYGLLKRCKAFSRPLFSERAILYVQASSVKVNETS